MYINDETILTKYFDRWENSALWYDGFKRYKIAFQNMYKITYSTKLRDFQYRLLLNKIITNTKLHAWALADDDLCTFCGGKSETVEHLFLKMRIRRTDNEMYKRYVW